MNEQKLIVVIMGQNCEKFLPMCLESVKQADGIVYCDGGSKDKTLNYLEQRWFCEFEKLTKEYLNQIGGKILEWRIIKNKYNQEDKTILSHNNYYQFLFIHFFPPPSLNTIYNLYS